jgi:hypothetical protein
MFFFPQTDGESFRRGHEDWLQSLNRTCGLFPNQFPVSSQQRSCVLTQFRTRANLYRSRLTGDALAESRLSPEQHVQIQSTLSTMGLLNGNPDGEFGPLTREAITRFHEQVGDSQNLFLTPAQMARLMQAPTLAVTDEAQNPTSGKTDSVAIDAPVRRVPPKDSENPVPTTLPSPKTPTTETQLPSTTTTVNTEVTRPSSESRPSEIPVRPTNKPDFGSIQNTFSGVADLDGQQLLALGAWIAAASLFILFILGITNRVVIFYNINDLLLTLAVFVYSFVALLFVASLWPKNQTPNAVSWVALGLAIIGFVLLVLRVVAASIKANGFFLGLIVAIFKLTASITLTVLAVLGLSAWWSRHRDANSLVVVIAGA